MYNRYFFLFTQTQLFSFIIGNGMELYTFFKTLSGAIDFTII